MSSKSAPHSVAGALAGVLRESPTCEIQVIGAGALNQAIKAIVIARSYLLEDSVDLACVPLFAEVTIDGQPRTAIRLVVERRPISKTAAVAAPAFDEIEMISEQEVPGGLFGHASESRRTNQG